VAVRNVLIHPHPSLKQRARALGPEDAELADRVAVDLLDTMRSNQGCVGIAAPQVDELVRLVVVDVTGHPKTTACHGLLVVANPRIVRAAGAEVGREGCLSIPELTANVRRATEIAVEAEVPGGERIEVETSGFEARCIQHELDHLDGLLFLDRVDSLTTDVFRRRRTEPGAGGERGG
jgi:peptide deformylase